MRGSHNQRWSGDVSLTVVGPAAPEARQKGASIAIYGAHSNIGLVRAGEPIDVRELRLDNHKVHEFRLHSLWQIEERDGDGSDRRHLGCITPLYIRIDDGLAHLDPEALDAL